MQRVTIAAGESTIERLQKEEPRLQESLSTKNITYCSTPDELNEALNDTDTLVSYSDFPLPYKDICFLAKESQSVNNVIGLEYASENKLWLYDGVTVANCITPDEEAAAINRALTVPKTVNFISQWVVGILLAFFLTGAIAYTHHQIALASKDVETTQQQEDTQVNSFN